MQVDQIDAQAQNQPDIEIIDLVTDDENNEYEDDND